MLAKLDAAALVVLAILAIGFGVGLLVEQRVAAGRAAAGARVLARTRATWAQVRAAADISARQAAAAARARALEAEAAAERRAAAAAVAEDRERLRDAAEIVRAVGLQEFPGRGIRIVDSCRLAWDEPGAIYAFLGRVAPSDHAGRNLPGWSRTILVRDGKLRDEDFWPEDLYPWLKLPPEEAVRRAVVAADSEAHYELESIDETELGRLLTCWRDRVCGRRYDDSDSGRPLAMIRDRATGRPWELRVSLRSLVGTLDPAD